MVPEDQLSIAIGKSGQNVRLASKLSGYDIDIVSGAADKPEEAPAAAPAEDNKDRETVTTLNPVPKLKKKEQLESSLLEALEEHGE